MSHNSFRDLKLNIFLIYNHYIHQYNYIVVENLDAHCSLEMFISFIVLNLSWMTKPVVNNVIKPVTLFSVWLMTFLLHESIKKMKIHTHNSTCYFCRILKLRLVFSFQSVWTQIAGINGRTQQTIFSEVLFKWVACTCFICEGISTQTISWLEEEPNRKSTKPFLSFLSVTPIVGAGLSFCIILYYSDIKRAACCVLELSTVFFESQKSQWDTWCLLACQLFKVHAPGAVCPPLASPFSPLTGEGLASQQLFHFS